MSALKAGPKAAVTADPLSFKGWPADRGKRRARFVNKYVVTPKGVGGGKRFRLRPWQRDIVLGAFGPGIRTALVSIPRANGKTALAAALAVAELFSGPMGAEVLVVASDQRQAEIALRMARRMIELSPELAVRAQPYKDRIVVPHTDSTMIALPADPGALHGWDPSLLIVDELHVVTEDVWEAVTSASGKRPESLVLAISTPATSRDSIMWKLVEHGRTGEDPSFYLKEYAAPSGCAVDDEQAWAAANPALGDFLASDGLAAARRTLREPVFRQLRLGQWVEGVGAWLPFGAWGACRDDLRRIGPRDRVVLAFDGSASGDSTALVGCTTGPDPHVWVEAVWENPGDPAWRVPRGDVDRAVDLAFSRYNVVEMAADPWGWRSELETWAARYGPRRVLEWNTAAAQRMAPATDRFYAAVVDKSVTHDGDPRLAAHIDHCVARQTPLGDVVAKDKRLSTRKIDAAVASIVALDRATHHTNNRRHRAASF